MRSSSNKYTPSALYLFHG